MTAGTGKSDAFVFFGAMRELYLLAATPGLLILKQVGGFSLAIDVIDRVPRLQKTGEHVTSWVQDQILGHVAHAREHGIDPLDMQAWTWPRRRRAEGSAS